MKKKSQQHLLVLLAMLMVTFLVSCSGSSPKAYIKSFEKFVAKVEADGDNFSNADWDKADAELSEFSDKYNKLSNKFTKEEKQHIVELNGRYLVKKGKVKGGELLDVLGGLFSNGAETLDNLFDGLGNIMDDLSDEIDEGVDALEDALDDLDERLEEWGESLEDYE